MATARELLEQADALMRRNRKRGKGPLDASTLTGVLEARDGLTVAPTVILPDVATGDAEAIVLERVPDAPPATAPRMDVDNDGMPLDTLGDVPVLTDVVNWPSEDDSAADIELREPAPDIAPIVTHDAFPASNAEAAALAEHAPTIAVLEREIEPVADGGSERAEVPGETVGAFETKGAEAALTSDDTGPAKPFLDDDFILDIPPVENARDASPAPVVVVAGTPHGDAAWQGLAEEVRMQVLQRLDLFTDTGLREQLGARLSPIVERASAQLIETINRELGDLVRGYVAEEIEREIESFRIRSDK
jgi:hypothetical protein